MSSCQNLVFLSDAKSLKVCRSSQEVERLLSPEGDLLIAQKGLTTTTMAALKEAAAAAPSPPTRTTSKDDFQEESGTSAPSGGKWNRGGEKPTASELTKNVPSETAKEDPTSSRINHNTSLGSALTGESVNSWLESTTTTNTTTMTTSSSASAVEKLDSLLYSASSTREMVELSSSEDVSSESPQQPDSTSATSTTDAEAPPLVVVTSAKERDCQHPALTLFFAEKKCF